MKLGPLFDKFTCERREEMQNSLVIMSLTLASIAVILTMVMTTPIHFVLDVYAQLDLKSVEATTNSTAPPTTQNNNAPTGDNTAQNPATRSYANSVFGIKLEYPITWSAFELNSRFRDNLTYAVALLRTPLENVTDKYAERVNFNMQGFKSNNVTLDGYTSAILNSYANTSGVKVVESSATSLAGQPAHKIVLTDDRVDSLKLKKMQVWSVINKSKAYVVTFAAEESKYQSYLPQFQHILDSLGITSSSDNPQEKTELPFDDPISGIKLQYPTSWTKIQIGQPPRSNVDLIVAFFHQENRNASISRIGIATQQLVSQNVNLEQYSTNQLKAIERVNATGIQDHQTKIGNNAAHSAVFNLNGTKVMQIWTLKGDKAYIFAYQASPTDYPKGLATFQKIANTLELKE